MKSFVFDETRPARAFVTGGCGFIGHHLVMALLAKGYDVSVLDDLSSGSSERLPSHPRLSVCVGSVLNQNDVDRSSVGCDIVFHLASVIGMQLVRENPEYTFKVSAEGTFNVLQAVGDVPTVLFSSSAVYGLSRSGSVSEKETIRSTDAIDYDGEEQGYARGKQELESIGIQRANQGLPTLIVRPFNVIGSGQIGRYGMVVPRFIKNAMHNQPLTVFDDGLQTRCFSDVETFLGSLLQLTSIKDAWLPNSNIYNVGSKSSTSILELAHIVKSVVRSQAPIVYKAYSDVYPGKKDVRERIPDTNHIENTLGEIKWPSVEEIVISLIDEASISPAVGYC